MSFFKKSTGKKRITSRGTLGFEALEPREMLSVSPLAGLVLGNVEQHPTGFQTESLPSLTVEERMATSIKLSWKASEMSDLRDQPFQVQRKNGVDKDGKDVWVQVGGNIPYVVGKDEYTYTVTGLTASTEYTLRVIYGSYSLGQGETEEVTVSTLESELKATALSSTEIQLKWNIHGKTGTYFQVMMEVDGVRSSQGRVSTSGSASKEMSFTVGKLEEGKEYKFWIEYYDTASTSRKSQETSCKTLFVLETSEQRVDSVHLSWAAAMGGANHTIEVCPGTDKPTTSTNWAQATTEKISNTEYRVTGLEKNASYYFRVRYYVGTEARYSDVLKYSSPTTINVTDVTDSSAKISWTFKGASGLRYYVQISDTGVDGSWSDYPGGSTSSQEYLMNNLEAGKTYYVRVRYYVKTDVEAFTAPSKFTTGIVTKLDGVTDHSATISWVIPDAAKFPGSKFEIQRCDSTLNANIDSNWKTVESNVTGSSYTNDYLASNKEYFFRVAYKDVNNETRYTLYTSARTCGKIEAGESSIDSVELTWDFSPKSQGLTVQMFMGSSPPSEAAWGMVPETPSYTQDAQGNITGCTVTGLKPGQQYYFRVVYTPKDGSESLTTDYVVKNTETGKLVSTGTTQTSVNLRWALAGFDRIVTGKEFVIFRNESGTSTWAEVLRVDPSKRNCTISGLMAQTNYNFKIAYAGEAHTQAVAELNVWTDAYEVQVPTSELGMNSAQIEWTFRTDKDDRVNSSQAGDGGGHYIIQKYTGTGEPDESDRYSSSDTLWTQVDRVDYVASKEVHFYALTGLETNSTQYYRIVYTYRTGDPEKVDGGNTWIVPLKTKYSAPVKVQTKTDLSSTLVNENTVRLEWKSQTGVTQYHVERRIGNSGSWQEIAVVNRTNYDVTGLAADTDYQFRVRYNTSQYTAVLEETTKKYDLSVISKQVDFHDARATVEMSYIAGLETNFKLFYRIKPKVESDDWPSGQFVAGVTDGTKVTFDLSTLRPETDYEFKVVYDSTATGVNVRHESNEKAIALSDELMPIGATAGSVEIKWDPSRLVDRLSSSQYFVHWREVGTSTWENSGPLATGTVTYTATGLDANKEYEFRVQYAMVNGASAYSSIKTVRTAQPKISVSASQYGEINFSWNFKSEDGGYVIQYKDEDGVWHDASGTIAGTARETKLKTIAGENIRSETEYTFRIAYKSVLAGETVYSDEVKVTTRFGMRVADNSLSSTSVKIEWDYTTEADTTYILQYRLVGTEQWIETIGDLPASTKEYVFSKLLAEEEYEFQLTYIDGVSKTATTTVTTPKTAPEAPSGLAINDIKSNQCTITWMDNSIFEDGFVIEVVNKITGQTYKETIGAGIGSDTMEYKWPGDGGTAYLDPNTTYTVKIHSYNNVGESTVVSKDFTTLDITRLEGLKTIKAGTTAKSVTLTWTINSKTNVPDATDFIVEFQDAETKIWYKVNDVTIHPTSTAKTFTCTISGTIKYGADKTLDIEAKTKYTFRVTPAGFTDSEGEYFGNGASKNVTATTATLKIATSLSSKSVSMTSQQVTFKDSDANLPPSEKTYKIHYVEGKFTDWSKIPSGTVIQEATVTQKTISGNNATMTHILTGLKPNTTYSFIVESIHDEGTTSTRPSSFKTTAPKAATTLKGGYTITAQNRYAFTFSWKPSVNNDPAVKLSYQILVSSTGKKGEFTELTIPSEHIGTSGQLNYCTVLFSDIAARFASEGKPITTLKTLYFQVQTVITRADNDAVLSTLTSTSGRVTLPKFT